MTAERLAGTHGIVTGASGFVGRHVLSTLPAGCRVTALYRQDTSFPAWASSLAADVTPLQLDLSQAALAEHMPGADWLLHLAATTPSAGAADFGSLITACARNAVMGVDVPRIVDVSSGSVYSGLTGALGPHATLAPTGEYGRAKLAAERAISEAATCEVTHARLFNPFGPGERPARLLPSLIAQALAHDATVRLTMPPEHRLQPLWIGDAASALTALVAMDHTGPIDICGPESLTVTELVHTIFQQLSPDCEPQVMLDDYGVSDWIYGVASATEMNQLVGSDALGLAAAIERATV